MRASITPCVLLVLAAHGWQLANTDWRKVGTALLDCVIAPVTAAAPAATSGTGEPEPPSPAPLAQVALPAHEALPSSFSLSVRDDVQEEMAHLLNELRARPRPPVAEAVPTGGDLARAAVAKRLEEMVAKLEALSAERSAAVSAAATELAKPKALLENMKPPEAAAILASMDDTVAARICMAMDERKAAAVLAAMPSERAARVTLMIRSFAAETGSRQHARN
jgi:hypothetical protein